MKDLKNMKIIHESANEHRHRLRSFVDSGFPSVSSVVNIPGFPSVRSVLLSVIFFFLERFFTFSVEHSTIMQDSVNTEREIGYWIFGCFVGYWISSRPAGSRRAGRDIGYWVWLRLCRAKSSVVNIPFHRSSAVNQSNYFFRRKISLQKKAAGKSSCTSIWLAWLLFVFNRFDAKLYRDLLAFFDFKSLADKLIMPDLGVIFSWLRIALIF